MRLLWGVVLALLVFVGLIWLGFGRNSQTVYAPNAPGPSVLVTTSQPGNRPASSPATNPATDSASDKQHELPATPPYLTIVEPIADRKPKLEATIASPTTLHVHTDGIRQLRLTKAQWPHDAHGSIAVIIDGQGIEWTRKRAVLDLVCGQNGGWSVLPESAATTSPGSP